MSIFSTLLKTHHPLGDRRKQIFCLLSSHISITSVSVSSSIEVTNNMQYNYSQEDRRNCLRLPWFSVEVLACSFDSCCTSNVESPSLSLSRSLLSSHVSNSVFISTSKYFYSTTITNRRSHHRSCLRCLVGSQIFLIMFI